MITDTVHFYRWCLNKYSLKKCAIYYIIIHMFILNIWSKVLIIKEKIHLNSSVEDLLLKYHLILKYWIHSWFHFCLSLGYLSKFFRKALSLTNKKKKKKTGQKQNFVEYLVVPLITSDFSGKHFWNVLRRRNSFLICSFHFFAHWILESLPSCFSISLAERLSSWN